MFHSILITIDPGLVFDTVLGSKSGTNSNIHPDTIRFDK